MKKYIYIAGILLVSIFFIAQISGGPDCIEDYGNNVRKICTPKENVILWEQNVGQSADNDAVRKVKYDKADLNDFFFSKNTRVHFLAENGKVYYVTMNTLRDPDCQGSSGDFSITPLVTPRCWFGDNIREYNIRLDPVSEDADSFRLFPENTRYYNYAYDKEHVYFNGFYRSDDADPATFRRVVTDNPDKKLPEKLYTDNQHLYLDYRKVADESWDDLSDIRIIPVSVNWKTLMSGIILRGNRAVNDNSGFTLKKSSKTGALYLFSDDNVAVSTAADIPVTADQQCYLNNIVVCHIGGDFYKIGYRYGDPLFEKITDSNRTRISKEWDNVLSYY
ncbi:hypothetical protein [Morganella morganii]|uniref:hypothetical protein n=1 Tax=Morganella morganii TaxID=582 RepID=UPI001A25FA9C|nr:hypothetical protein [Morganella morganii]ELA9087334.1 hypothetical protein [Morganella morganii]MCU6375368.1 hypothetical protein [Morganella morganii]HAT1512185.1 hypothetical protein [Morganella morganii]HBH7051483.1 hypothetical protein [Morganella morganii]HEI9845300.1 hypothetical protein [Morganella morganii]